MAVAAPAREKQAVRAAEGGTQPVGRVVSEGASLGGSGVGSASFWKFFFELAFEKMTMFMNKRKEDIHGVPYHAESTLSSAQVLM